MVWMTKTCESCAAVLNISSAVGTMQCEYCGSIVVLQAPEPLPPPMPPPQYIPPYYQPQPQPQRSVLEDALPLLLLGGRRSGAIGAAGLLGGLIGGFFD